MNYPGLGVASRAPGMGILANNGRWSPLQLPALKLWLSAKYLNLADGASVATWTDLSGNNNHATQPTAGNRPVFVASVDGTGLPGVRFSVSSTCGMLTPGTATLTLPYSIIVTYSYRSTTSAFRRAVSSVSLNKLIGPYTNGYNVYNGTMFVPQQYGAETTQNKRVISAVVAGGTTTQNWLNGILRGSAQSAYDWGAITLGGAGIVPQPLDGDEFEIIACGVALSSLQLAQVNSYLVSEWRIT